MNDQRNPALASVRTILAELDKIVRALGEAWPERYPVPENVDAAYTAHESAIATARDGRLRALIDTRPIGVADYALIADAAAAIDELKCVLVDQPGELARYSAMVGQLHDLVERAGAVYATSIYGIAEGSTDATD